MEKGDIPSSIAGWTATKLSGDEWGLASVYTERWIHQPTKLDEGNPYKGRGLTPYESSIIFIYFPWFRDQSNTFSNRLVYEIPCCIFSKSWFNIAWFYIVPLVVIMDVPVYDFEQQQYFRITEYGDINNPPVYPFVQWMAFKSLVRTIAIGAMLGWNFRTS